MSYSINDTPISFWSLEAGTIKESLKGYALKGGWSLPKRLGETHYDWQGELEPYIDADDIMLDGRDLTLSLVCKAQTASELIAKIDIFKEGLDNNFTLLHPKLGAFEVGLQNIDVKIFGRIRAQLTLKLREPNPKISTNLPALDGGVYGIDGYSWNQLGFTVSNVDDVANLPQWKGLSVTVDPRKDNWIVGYRSNGNISIEGTMRGVDYEDFKAKVDLWQALMSKAGLRTVKRYDGSVYQCFCVDGFDVDVLKFGDIHWGEFNCKMIVL